MTEQTPTPPAARQHSVSRWVDASPEEVYAVVSDVTRTGEWSPTCRACRWVDPQQTGVGARFEGDNQNIVRSWTTVSTVTAADPGRRFAWTVGEGYVDWAYEMEPTEEGDTLLTQTWHFTPRGADFFAQRYGADAAAQADQRERSAREDMPASLARIAAVVEGGRPTDA